jgi:hypothetical protein
MTQSGHCQTTLVITRPNRPAWRETRDLNRIEPRRDPTEGATCSDAVEAVSR